MGLWRSRYGTRARVFLGRCSKHCLARGAAERTRLINRLRINLVILDPELEAKVPSRKLDYPGQLQRISRRLRTVPQTARVRIARKQAKQIEALTREAESLKRELRDLIRLHRPELLEETGCGPLTAAILIGQTAGAEPL